MTAMQGAGVTARSMFIDGEWCSAGSGATTECTSPATGEVIGTVPDGDREDARRAIAAANRAADDWGRLTAFERAAKMHVIGDAIEARRDELARTLTLDQGKPLRAEAYDEVAELVEYWRMAAEDATRLGGELPHSFSPGKRAMLIRRPRGTVGIITPWNWPYTMPAELIAPALAAGNTVVWTPAPSTSVCSVALAECIVDGRLPPGVFDLVTGPAGAARGRRDREQAAARRASASSARRRRAVTSPPRPTGKATRAGDGRQRTCRGDGRRRPQNLGRVRGHGGRLLPVRRPKLHGRRAAACPPSRCRTTSSTALARRQWSAGGASSGTRSTDATTMGPLNNPRRRGEDGPSRERRARARRRGRGRGERASGFPTDLYWNATVLSGVPADSRVATEETFGRSLPSSESTPWRRRSSSRTPRPTASCPPSSRATSAPG